MANDATDNGTSRNNKKRRVSPDDPEPPQQPQQPQQQQEPQQQQQPQQQLHKVMTSYTYALTIPGLDLPLCQIGEYADSPSFTVRNANDSDHEYTCFLRVYGNGFDADTKSYVCVRVYLVDEIDSTSRTNFHCKLSVLTKHNYEVLSQYSSITSLNSKMSQNYIAFRRLVARDVLSQSTCDFLQENHDLILLCRVGFAKYSNEISFEEVRLKVSMNVGRDITSLYQTQKVYDLVIIAEKIRFPVHKCIIAARSPSFFIKLCSKMRNNTIIIEDMEAEVLSKILDFIYKGTFSGLQDISEKVMVAAIEYGIDALKDICQANLFARITVDNAIHLLLTAEKYYAYLLKETVMEFIVSHAAQIIETSGFRDLGQSHHELMKEIFSQLAIK